MNKVISFASKTGLSRYYVEKAMHQAGIKWPARHLPVKLTREENTKARKILSLYKNIHLLKTV